MQGVNESANTLNVTLVFSEFDYILLDLHIYNTIVSVALKLHQVLKSSVY